MKKIILISASLLFVGVLPAQNIGIGTAAPNGSALLHISSATKGLLIPRNNTAGITAINNPAKGLMVLDTSRNQLMVNMGTATSPNWQTIAANSAWSLTGNRGVNPASQFIGTTDTFPLIFRANNASIGHLNPVNGNIFFGSSTGGNNAGTGNVAIGTEALANNGNESGVVAIGSYALNSYNNTSLQQGGPCLAIGSLALYTNTIGRANTAIGFSSMYSNSIGETNVAVGNYTLFKNQNGYRNVAVGFNALYNNLSGGENIAVGDISLYNNQDGSGNSVTGYAAMYQNISGSNNTVIGRLALYTNTESYNTAIGAATLRFTTASQYNVAVGYNAASQLNHGYNNVFVGANTETNAGGYFNVIALGQAVTCTAPSQARIGNAATNSIGGYANWSNISDGRYKKDVNENVPGIDFIMKLRPVTYHLDVSSLSKKLNEGRGRPLDKYSLLAIADKEKLLQTGFIAQEVEASAQKLGYDFSGVDKPKNENDLYALRYAEFVVPLVKAVQEQQAIIDLLRQQNIDLEKRMRSMEAQLLHK